MFNWLKRKAGSTRILGLDMSDEGFALALIDTAAAQGPRIAGVRWCPCRPADDKAASLKQAVKALGARGLPVVATLQPAAYSLVQLEAPDLADDELREAMRWRVKDLIDFPVEEAVVDVFRLPASRRPGAPELLYVVVARASAVDALATLLQGAGLEILAIDIVEMAIRNLCLHHDHPDRPRAYLYLQPGQSVIEIADGPQVYLSRRILQDYDAGADAELLHAQMENLALEVQRSLDYFESQYALGPAGRLSVIVREEPLYQAFSAVASVFLTVPAERFSLTAIDGVDRIDPELIGRGVTAIGAAMRGVAWAA